jgi:glycosyltransferase involved in cell wall biosynthesis
MIACGRWPHPRCIIASPVRSSFLTPTSSRLGYGLLTAVRGMATALAEHGQQVSVLAGRDAFTDEDAALWAGVALHTFPLSPPRSLAFSRQLELWLERHADFDVLNVQGVWAGMNVSGVSHARRIGARVVMAPHGMLDSWALARSRLKKRVARVLFADRVLAAVDCFHALAVSEADALRALGLRAPIAVIANGVALPAKTSAAGGRPRLLFLGRLHTKKCIGELIEAWNVVGVEAPDWELQIAGPDELRMRGRLRDATKVSNIRFVGELQGEAKERAYAEAHAFVLPSRSEGLPMTVLEAWAYGLPVVMTEACNLSEGFARDAALRVEPDVTSIVDGLRRLVAMSHRDRLAMGARGRALVEERHAWSHAAAQLAAVHAWLRDDGPRPDCVR